MKPIYLCVPIALALSIVCVGQMEQNAVPVPQIVPSDAAALPLSVDEAVAAAV